MIKYKCTCPVNKDACHIYSDQKCCVGCKKNDNCRCDRVKCKCEYKVKY